MRVEQFTEPFLITKNIFKFKTYVCSNVHRRAQKFAKQRRVIFPMLQNSESMEASWAKESLVIWLQTEGLVIVRQQWSAMRKDN